MWPYASSPSSGSIIRMASKLPWRTWQWSIYLVLWTVAGIHCILDCEATPGWILVIASAKCWSVRKPHTNLPDSPASLTSASKYFQMLPGPLGALHSALRLCKSILRMLRDSTFMIVNFWSCGDLCTSLQEIPRAGETSAQALRGTWYNILTAVDLRVPQLQGISFIIFVFVTVTKFATSYHGMYYLSLHIYTYRDGLSDRVYIFGRPRGR